MKTNAKLIIAFSTLMIILWAYQKQKPSARLSALVKQGKWKVNQYRDNGVDETNNYTGYEFQFKPNGVLVAKKDENLLNGTWKSVSEKRKAKLYVGFKSSSQLDELSEDWVLLSRSQNSIELADMTTGDGGIDYLSLGRIS
jgi:hypothetical protein